MKNKTILMKLKSAIKLDSLSYSVSLLILLVTVILAFNLYQNKVNQQSLGSLEAIAHLKEKELKDCARQITVKVFAEDTWGSGIIIKKQGSIYTILTNAHVLVAIEDKYSIQTPDGLVYQAFHVEGIDFTNYDLALLQFNSDKEYEVATIGESSKMKQGDQVVASGFPFYKDTSQEEDLKYTEGEITIITEKSLEDGYQIGYSNEIKKGMSGGPVINLQGEVIAVNGIHPYPLFGNPYIYSDGSEPPSHLKDVMFRSSFAIPIETFLDLAPQFSN